MKKLLTTITLSALVGTSAGNLKPVFTNNVVSHNFKSNQLNNKDISIKNQNNTNPFITLIIKEKIKTSIIISLPNNCIYVGTKSEGLWKSTDGINLEQVINGIPSNIYITSIAIAPNGTIWVGSLGKGLYKSTDGTNFEQLKSGVGTDDFIGSIAIAKNGVVYVGSSNYSGSKKTVYKSIDGNTFTPMSGTTGQIQSLITDSSNNVYAGTTNPSGSEGIIYKSNGIDEFHEIFKTVGAVETLITTSDGTVYAGTKVYNTKQGFVYKSIDGNTFTPISGTTGVITSLAADNYNNIYAGTEKGLYKSNGTDEFTKVNEVPDDDVVNSVWIAPNGVIYIGTENKGLYTINPINLLLNINKPDTFDKSWPLYNGIVYNSVQKIDIKDNLVASAILDGKSITIPTTDLDIPSGEHNLILTLKDKTLATIFGGDVITGQVTYKLWVKTLIDKNKIDYSTKIDDTQLYTGLVSNAGNTNGFDIIQTKSKDGSSHPANLDLSINDKLIDFDVNKSFYESGTVNETTNDFTATGTHQSVFKNFSIKTDGIYHLHLEDMVGNKYDSYLELGESNWKLKGTFDDSELDKLKFKLNVTVNLTDPTQKAKALGWLTNYDKFASNLFVKSLQQNGKGFEQDIRKDLESDFKWFLKSLTYEPNNEPKFDNKFIEKYILQNKLKGKIIEKANEILKNGLNSLPQNLNVDTKNVVNKSTLTSYTNWINNYQDFISKNKDKWINDIANIASRGFATKDQENQIKAQVSQFLNNNTIKKYLKNIVWEDNKLLKTTSNDYLQYVELDKLQADTINWVNEKLPDINQKYKKAIQDAESDLNLHGYSIYTLLNGKPQPQTKTEIDNFSDGQSYHDWLQSQANMKFKGYQLAMGFGISIPLLLVVVAIGWVIRSRTNPKYNGVARAKQAEKKDKKELSKKIKEEQ